MRYLFLFLIPIVLALADGCSNGIDPYNVKIYSVSSNNLKAGDTLTIKGTNFGIMPDPCKEYVIFNSDLAKRYRPDDYKVVDWTFSKIILIVTKNAQSGKMCVYNLGEFSNCIEMNISGENL